jgi:hypothetical protein
MPYGPKTRSSSRDIGSFVVSAALCLGLCGSLAQRECPVRCILLDFRRLPGRMDESRAQKTIDYLTEENCVLKQQLGGRRLR